MYQTGNNPNRIVRMHELTHLLGVSRASIYRLLKMNRFPQGIKIGISAVGWKYSTVMEYIAEREVASITIH